MRIKLAIVAAIVLTGIYAAAQLEVTTHYAAGYDMAQAKTFTIQISTNWNDPPNEEFAKKVVAEELTKRGYTQAEDPMSADLLVEIYGATKDKTSVQSIYSGTGSSNFGWAGPAGVSTTWETTFKVGTGVIDIFDIKSRRLVFRGAAEDEIQGIGPQNQPKIANGVARIFKDFPKSKG
jgi:hypothetical protein